jgi:hypothetical protein
MPNKKTYQENLRQNVQCLLVISHERIVVQNTQQRANGTGRVILLAGTSKLREEERIRVDARSRAVLLESEKEKERNQVINKFWMAKRNGGINKINRYIQIYIFACVPNLLLDLSIATDDRLRAQSHQ